VISPPKPIRQPKQRLPERKSVTIAVGCLCGDGFILGADTQLTAVGYHKSYGRKIYLVDSPCGGVDFSFAYSGSPTFASDFGDGLLGKIQDTGEPTDIFEARNVVAGVLSRYVESDVHSNHLLVGFRIRDVVGLMRTSGYSVSLETDERPVFVGAGDSSALALALPLVSRFGLGTMQHGATLAILLIEIAKKYVDGCGGDTDILMVPSVGKSSFLGLDTIQNEFLDLHRQIGAALSTVFYPGCEEGEREEVITELVDELRLASRILEIAFKKRDPQTLGDQQ
jgi:hypothetical protein